MLMKIIDVSRHQKDINWEKVAAAGIEGAIIRAGYGLRSRDSYFTQNMEGAIRAGIKYLGVYWFSYAYSIGMTQAEAVFCNEVILPYKDCLNLGVFYDWEYDSMRYAQEHGVFPDRQLITDMNREFCDAMEGLGYIAGYYLNNDYRLHYIDESQLKRWRKWFARYTSVEQKDCFIWQYTSKGQVDGIVGAVDMDILNGQLTQIGGGEAAAQLKSNDEIAREVIAGKWGNGYERKNRLKNAGYVYADIQALVNQMVKAGTTYTVQKGDTLTAIAKKHNTTVADIVARNNIKNPNKIYVEQVLYV